jgi:hypothetical protein
MKLRITDLHSMLIIRPWGSSSDCLGLLYKIRKLEVFIVVSIQNSNFDEIIAKSAILSGIPIEKFN